MTLSLQHPVLHPSLLHCPHTGDQSLINTIINNITLHRNPEDILLSLCPPKAAKPIKQNKKNLLIVSTLDGYITALDLNR